MITPERILQIEQIVNRYGPPNCWTGTSGSLAAIIRELLNELKVGGVADPGRPGCPTTTAQAGLKTTEDDCD